MNSEISLSYFASESSQYISPLVNEAQCDLSLLMIQLAAIFPQSPLAFYNKSTTDDWLFFF